MPRPTSPPITFRAFDPALDATWLHGLWHRTLHPRWAIPLGAMLMTLESASLLLVAERTQRSVGFCALQSCRQRAGLTLMLVEPAEQHTGIGTALLAHVEALLSLHGVSKLSLGAGEGDYFWPGLPIEQHQALPFFHHRGFTDEELDEDPTEDLIQNLDNFEIPPWVSQRLASSGTTLRLADPALRQSVLAFERQHFPDWASHFETELEQAHFQKILVAIAPAGEVLGTILMEPTTSIPWRAIAGQKIGTLNTLGVAPLHQGKGIGLALTAAAMLHLKALGCTACFIQWTGLAPWYAKLGTRHWARYMMASKPLKSH